MKTLVCPAARHLFIALCLGAGFLSIVACQSTTIVPVSRPELVHLAPKVHAVDSLVHELPRPGVLLIDSITIDPQPRPQHTTY
ncbi:hypothetical protein GO755_38155 [Spirosoma sp. HMF4905]|uniref:Uncharacterized protein n=1 Tax=Spirosoma arboris TaxID=2682092 RepID=A0A7K1SQ82_9BACT|nr:hypothetical protein [Spirosoma arboris]MVM35900.1 hypothetical protein [Spirosoma arboris]